MSSSVGSLTRHTHTHTQTYAHRVTHLFFLLFFSFNETRKTRTHKHTHTDARRSAASANKCKKKKFCPYTSTGLCYASYKRLGSPIQTGKDVQNGFDRVELTPKSLTERRKVTNKQIGNIWDRIIDENEGPFWERKQK